MITLLPSGSRDLGLACGPKNLRVEADQKETSQTSLGGPIRDAYHLVPASAHAEPSRPSLPPAA